MFVVGGGNYIEYQNLQDYCRRQPVPKRITYGTSQLMSPRQFLEQVGVAWPPPALLSSCSASLSHVAVQLREAAVTHCCVARELVYCVWLWCMYMIV